MVGLLGFEPRTKRLETGNEPGRIFGLWCCHASLGANSRQLSLPTRDILLLMVVLLLLFGGGGFYFGGSVIGGSRLGLILVICLVIDCLGGFRSTKS
jgi:hypothetical protein